MRKIILSINITEDGFIAGPEGELDWHFPFWNAEMGESLGKLLSKADTILLGRKTYTALASYWPFAGADPSLARADLSLAEMMNSYSKVVVSKTLKRLIWVNSSLIKGNIGAEIADLKLRPGKDIVVLGSCRLLAYLLKHNMIDEYHLWLHPISIKHGKRLAKLLEFKIKAEPIYQERFVTGVMRLCYQETGSKQRIHLRGR